MPSLTLWGQYVSVLSPSSLSSLNGGGLSGQIDWLLEKDWSVGVDFGQASVGSGASQFGSLGLILRYSAPSLLGLNAYGQLELGHDLFRSSSQNPLGGSFRSQVLLGDLYVLNKSWAIDVALGIQGLDGPPGPVSVFSARLGLNYSFRGQRFANLNVEPMKPVNLGPQPEPLVMAGSVAQLLGTKTSITVREGDSLWNLARRKSVLGNAFLWPLLYKTNRDQITDPHVLEPGMRLKVLSHYSERETRLAAEAAGNSQKMPELFFIKD